MKAKVIVLSILFLTLLAISANAQGQLSGENSSGAGHKNHSLLTSIITIAPIVVGKFTDVENEPLLVWAPNIKAYVVHPAKYVWVGGVSVGHASYNIGPYIAVAAVKLSAISFSFTPYKVTGKNGSRSRLVMIDLEIFQF